MSSLKKFLLSSSVNFVTIIIVVQLLNIKEKTQYRSFKELDMTDITSRLSVQ